MMSPEVLERAKVLYMTDAVFHARVELAALVVLKDSVVARMPFSEDRERFAATMAAAVALVMADQPIEELTGQ